MKKLNITSRNIPAIAGLLMATGCSALELDLSGIGIIDATGSFDVHFTNNVIDETTVVDALTGEPYGVERKETSIRVDPRAIGASDLELSLVGIDPEQAWGIVRPHYIDLYGRFNVDATAKPENIEKILGLPINDYIKDNINNYFVVYVGEHLEPLRDDIPEAFPSPCSNEESRVLVAHARGVQERLWEEYGPDAPLVPVYLGLGAGKQMLMLPTEKGNWDGAMDAQDYVREFCDEDFIMGGALYTGEPPKNDDTLWLENHGIPPI